MLKSTRNGLVDPKRIRNVYSVDPKRGLELFTVVYSVDQRGRGSWQHLTPKEMLEQGYVTSEKFSKAKSFAAIRHPCDRILSEYRFTALRIVSMNRKDFNIWLEMYLKNDAEKAATAGVMYHSSHRTPQYEFIFNKNTGERYVHT